MIAVQSVHEDFLKQSWVSIRLVLGVFDQQHAQGPEIDVRYQGSSPSSSTLTKPVRTA